MPHGGFGNLIALPLQKVPRRSGYSVFLDDLLEPIPDQWRFLAGVPRMEPLTLERIVRGTEKSTSPMRATQERAAVPER